MKYSEKDLVAFGNYLLSQTRDERTSNQNKGNVTHADMMNFKNELD